MTQTLATASGAAEAPAAPVVLLARQPILDARSEVTGHELLYRRQDGTGWPIEDESKATAHVVVSAFSDLGLFSVTDGARAWINMPRAFLMETELAVLPQERVVLELLERNLIDPPYLERIAALVDAGFQIALDDFEWTEATASLLRFATYVKLDLRALGLDGVRDHVQRLAGEGVRIVAEKVETKEEYDGCLALGIDLFQGYYFEKPRLVVGNPTPHAALRRLRMATSLGPESTFEDIERIVTLDPGTSLRLLRYINSAALAMRHRISSLRQALTLVGTTTVRQWILLVLLGDLGRVKPAVLTAALVRAKLCELLARNAGVRGADSAFIVGLLSIADALLDVPLERIIPTLPLTDDVANAILYRHGRLGELLTVAIALDHGELTRDPKGARSLTEAIRWADAQVEQFASV